MDDKECALCGKEEDSPDHLWTCDALQKEREEADKDLAGLNPEALPMAVKCGIAPVSERERKLLGTKRPAPHDEQTERNVWM